MDFFAKIETDNDNLIVPCFTENIKSEYYNFKNYFLNHNSEVIKVNWCYTINIRKHQDGSFSSEKKIKCSNLDTVDGVKRHIFR